MTRAFGVDGRAVYVSDRGLTQNVIPDVTPDSGNLQHHYDATALSLSDGDTVSSWPDEAGSSDLTGADPTYSTNVQNGNAVVSFGGTDYLDVDAPLISQPNTIYAVLDTTQGSSAEYIVDKVGGGYARQICRWEGDNAQWDMQSANGSQLNGGTTASPIIYTAVFDGPNSVLGENGSETTGDADTGDLDGITVGAINGGGDVYLNGWIGELLFYSVGHDSTTRAEVESYLSNKWGIAVA